jgi:hypothetical protein
VDPLPPYGAPKRWSMLESVRQLAAIDEQLSINGDHSDSGAPAPVVSAGGRVALLAGLRKRFTAEALNFIARVIARAGSSNDPGGAAASASGAGDSPGLPCPEAVESSGEVPASIVTDTPASTRLRRLQWRTVGGTCDGFGAGSTHAPAVVRLRV